MTSRTMMDVLRRLELVELALPFQQHQPIVLTRRGESTSDAVARYRKKGIQFLPGHGIAGLPDDAGTYDEWVASIGTRQADGPAKT